MSFVSLIFLQIDRSLKWSDDYWHNNNGCPDRGDGENYNKKKKKAEKANQNINQSFSNIFINLVDHTQFEKI